jgi:hypothetical protein
MYDSEQPTVLSGDRLDGCYHACAFFRTPEEEYRVAAPYVREGIERGEKAVDITAPALRTERPHALRGDVIVDVLRTHPRVVIDGALYENPFFVPPDEFLRELRGRADRSS